MFLSVLKDQHLPFCLSVLLAASASLLLLCGFWLIAQFVADAEFSHLGWTALVWSVAALCSGLSAYLAHRVEGRLAEHLRTQTAQHLSYLPHSTLSRYSNSDLQALLTSDIARIHHLFAHLPSEIAVFIVVPLTAFSLLWLLLGAKTLLILTPALLASLYYVWILPKTSAKDSEARMQVVKRIIELVGDYFKGIKIQRVFGGEQDFLAQYQQQTAKFTSEMLQWVKKVATLSAFAVALLQAVSTFAITYALTYQQPLDIIAAALFFSLSFVTPVLRLGHGIDYLRIGKGALTRIKQFLSEEKIQWGTLTATATPDLTLEVDNACVQLDKTVSAHQPFNLRIEPHKLTVITGRSGCGKSTLLRAIAGLERLSSGEIRLNNTPIFAFDEHYFHQLLRYIPQQIQLPPCTIEQIISIEQPDIDSLRMQQTLSQLGLDYPFNQVADLLSGGERQRLQLAAAFISKAQIFLLDEPTSHLDEHSSQLVIQALRTLQQQGKTLVLVSHSQTLIQQADCVIHLSSI
ncbi:ATP-binding cassette domain-containing protein [Lonepinella koalarum]|uniref:ATP-binding cassette domain-containing protein n=1 Tax=Lonepinella koalarum TaxID=53417 RepID=UPI003F6E36CA